MTPLALLLFSTSYASFHCSVTSLHFTRVTFLKGFSYSCAIALVLISLFGGFTTEYPPVTEGSDTIVK